jgi:hypothetical protein
LTERDRTGPQVLNAHGRGVDEEGSNYEFVYHSSSMSVVLISPAFQCVVRDFGPE